MTDSPDEQAWRELGAKHPEELVAALRRTFDGESSFEITPAELSAETSRGSDDARALLHDAADRDFLTRRTRPICPACEEELPEDCEELPECPYCRNDLTAVPPIVEELFAHRGIRKRDVDWVLALHGMNTDGAWQEGFNWLVSRTYARMVPVAIYKYGVVRPGVLFPARQRQLARRLADRMRRLQSEAEVAGFHGPPDVIAHSFGTWLLGHALQDNPDLRVGRVIVAGCILRPDFDWDTLLARGQVETVLNHFATRDIWVRASQYVIPGSGPAGWRGFDGTAVINIPLVDAGHSDFFEPDAMPRIFRDVWRPFLSLPTAELVERSPVEAPTEGWKPVPWIIRATLPRYTIVLTALAVGLLLLLALGLGLPLAWNALSNWLQALASGSAERGVLP